MTPFIQRGGARIGASFWGAFNATWPFAKLTVEESGIQVSVLFRRYSFSPASVRRLSTYSGVFSRGLLVEHTVADYPPFVLFWSFALPELTAALQQRGFRVEES